VSDACQDEELNLMEIEKHRMNPSETMENLVSTPINIHQPAIISQGWSSIGKKPDTKQTPIVQKLIFNQLSVSHPTEESNCSNEDIC
jgi:hypothetical protein